MYLCCIESLSWFRSKLNFLWIFKVAQKSGQSPCTIIVHGLGPNFIKNGKVRILHFYNFFWYIYMYLCCIESLGWFRSKLDFLQIFKVAPNTTYFIVSCYHKWLNRERRAPSYRGRCGSLLYSINTKQSKVIFTGITEIILNLKDKI